MARKKTFAVIGLGRFGKSVLQELIGLDNEVLAIDINEERVNEVSNIASHAIICDTTDEEALINIGVKNIDHVVIAIGDNVQASILTSLILKELNVSEITVKAQNDYHERVLKKIGITDIIHPEQDMGKRIARRISSRIISETLELSKKYSLVELKATGKIVNKTLLELDLRNKIGINIVALKREDNIIIPDADEVINSNDTIIIVGSNQSIDKFEKYLLS
ncbi:TrkA family potassium uptake protein [Mycoplasmatota bacterium]|nr:TrkA family potassium uptake protein [Mycoplasmatota bacterium]